MYLSSIGQLEEVDDFSPIFSDGRILTASEKAQTRFKNAQTDALLVNAKLVRPDNPRITREWQENNPYTPEELSGNKPDKTDKRNPVGNALKSQQGREQANGSEVS
jgi:riboflavin biosynthesis pyrimidine reductase